MNHLVKAVTFDATNTIIRVRNGVGGAYKHVGYDIPVLRIASEASITSHFNQSFKVCWNQFPNFGYGKINAPQWWNMVTLKTLENIDTLNSMDSELKRVFCEDLFNYFSTPRAYELLPGIEKVLVLLKKSVQIGVITNNDSRIKSILHELFPGTFSFVLVSNEEGSAKPNVNMFKKSQKLFSVEPSQILHVGDSYTKDYLPAVSVGFKAVVLNEQISQLGIAHHPVISHLKDLPPLCGL